MVRFKLFPRFVMTFIISAVAVTIFAQSEIDTKEAARLHSLADTLAKHSNYDSALVYYTRAKNSYEKSKDWTEYFTLSVKLIQINDILGKYQKALAVYNHLDSIAAETVGTNAPIVASAHIYVGIVYYRLADYDAAIHHYKKAMEIQQYQAVPDTDKIVACYNNIGLLYQRKQDYGRALQYFLQSLNVVSGKKPGEFKNLGRLYNNISITYYYQLELDKSLEYAEKALKFKKNRWGEMNPQVGISYGNIALIYFEKNEYQKALQYQQKALKIYKATLDDNHPYIAKTLTNIANVYIKAGLDTSKAFEAIDQAIEIDKNRLGLHHPDIADLYALKGSAFSGMHNYAQALVEYQEGLKVLVPGYTNSSITDNPSVNNTTSRAILLSVLQKKAKALQEYAIQENQDIPLLKASLETSRLLIHLMDQLKLNYESESSKLLLTELSYQIFQTGIETSMMLAEVAHDRLYYHDAFYISEKTKANLLFASFIESQAQDIAGIPDSILQQEKQIRKSLTESATAVEQELQKKPAERDSAHYHSLTNQSFALQNQYQSLQDRLEHEYPKYFEMKYRVEPATVSDVQSVLDPHSGVLSYMVTADRLYIFVISQNAFNVLSEPIDDSFKTTIGKFVRAIKTFDKQAYVTADSILYSKLFAPVESRIQSLEKLVIVPSGDLFYLPFEALFNPADSKEMDAIIAASRYTDIPYLIKKYDISYHVSNSLYLQSKQSENRKLPPSFAGFAPVFDDSSAAARSSEPLALRAVDSLRSEIVGGLSYSTLEYSDDEVASIQDLFQQHHKKAKIYLRDDASEENFKSHLKEYKYIHLATHGFLNKEHPDLSGVLFAIPHDHNVQEDGVLYSGEMFNLNTQADLAVLSSCESGIGKLVPGEGVLALTRGFLYSGIPNVIVSLWKVYDKYASRLMVSFYSDLLDNEDYSHALRHAKLDLISDPTTAFPQKWSSFILIGR